MSRTLPPGVIARWVYPTWLRVLGVLVSLAAVWGLIALDWHGVQAFAVLLTSVGAPLATAESFRRTLLLTEVYLEDRNVFGNSRRIELRSVRQIVHGFKPALRIVGESGTVISIPSLLGDSKEIEAALVKQLKRSGVDVQRD